MGVCATASGADGAASNFIDDTRWELLNRTVYERRSYSHGDKSNGGRNATLPKSRRSDYAEEWGYGLMGSVESGFTPGLFGAGIDAHLYVARRLAGDDYRVGKIRMLPVDGQGFAQDDIVRGGVALKARLSSTVLKMGEQRTKTPIFSSSDSRLLPETMRGWLVTSKEIEQATLQAGHFTGSTDRNARGTNGALTVNYLNPATPRGDAFDFVGGTWKGFDHLSLSAYLGRLDDTWRTEYAGLAYARPLAGKRSIGFDLHVYRSDDTGRSLAGPIATTAVSGMATYGHGPHRIGAGWQKIIGDTPFDYVSRGAIWLNNASQLSDFNGPHEQSWQVRYEFDASGWGWPGLGIGAAYISSRGTDGSHVPANGGYAWLGYGRGGKHWERDLWLRYKVPSGAAKGLMLHVRHSMHRANKAQAELNAEQIRVALEYPLGR